jgi:hypothetical protein
MDRIFGITGLSKTATNIDADHGGRISDADAEYAGDIDEEIGKAQDLAATGSLSKLFERKTDPYWKSVEGYKTAQDLAGIVTDEIPEEEIKPIQPQLIGLPKKRLDVSHLPSSWADESESEAVSAHEHQDISAKESLEVARAEKHIAIVEPEKTSLFSYPEAKASFSASDTVLSSKILERLATLELRVNTLEGALAEASSKAVSASSRAAAAESALKQMKDECLTRLRTLDSNFLEVVDGAARIISEHQKQVVNLTDEEQEMLRRATALKSELEAIPEAKPVVAGPSMSSGQVRTGKGLKFKNGKWV